MTKAEVIWLLVRIVGLYLIYQAVEVTISTFGVLVVASEAPGVVSKSAGVLLPTLFRIVLYACLGIYLLSDGSELFRLLSHRPDDAGQ